MNVNFKKTELARAKAAYQIVFGQQIPFTVYETHDPAELTRRIDKAIRDMKPLDEFSRVKWGLEPRDARSKHIPLSVRALTRWRYMKEHRCFWS